MKPEEQAQQPHGAGASKAESLDEVEHPNVLVGKTERDVSRRKILDGLARAEYAEGVYDQVPDDFGSGR